MLLLESKFKSSSLFNRNMRFLRKNKSVYVFRDGSAFFFNQHVSIISLYNRMNFRHSNFKRVY